MKIISIKKPAAKRVFLVGGDTLTQRKGERKSRLQVNVINLREIKSVALGLFFALCVVRA